MSNKEVMQAFDKTAGLYDRTVHRYFSSRRAEVFAELGKGRILEVGAGTGTVTEKLVKRGKVVASDISFNMLKNIGKRLKIPLAQFDAEHFPFKKGAFDTIVSGETIYYLDNPERFFKEAFYVLRKGGVCAVSSTNRLWDFLNTPRSWMINLINSSSLLSKAAKAVNWDYGWADEKQFYGFYEKKIKQMFKQAGFSDIKTKPVVIFPFSKLDRFNRELEKTFLGKVSLGKVVWGRKG
ncbi:hypothetical protein CMO89_04420 [Candidatus Woesearchaeota archaeon]|nr:hypothetical protein [Candidatus Woesearchaeota archaeon]|tara:strand:+ start:5470 stop:6180 length:711 start_codon:yes stop_codon:yes gene_type:complete